MLGLLLRLMDANLINSCDPLCLIVCFWLFKYSPLLIVSCLFMAAPKPLLERHSWENAHIQSLMSCGSLLENNSLSNTHSQPNRIEIIAPPQLSDNQTTPQNEQFLLA